MEVCQPVNEDHISYQKLLEFADIILQKPIWEKIRLIKKYNTCPELKVYVLELVASFREVALKVACWKSLARVECGVAWQQICSVLLSSKTANSNQPTILIVIHMWKKVARDSSMEFEDKEAPTLEYWFIVHLVNFNLSSDYCAQPRTTNSKRTLLKRKTEYKTSRMLKMKRVTHRVQILELHRC